MNHCFDKSGCARRRASQPPHSEHSTPANFLNSTGLIGESTQLQRFPQLKRP